ncbi:serine/threonine protein kinase [Bifidobacterium aemilianum]|uniref:non-specific serine/threonine protein kinase n=1 Tax=Bifidobacterium aemilianum TaxID=2493120 RepID=A0A366KAR2_9BIFI|nr:Stk1 family PASTA domain-containing Ser/Thr kinase [Bifidobacterium aemilianum]RBP98203.1 serine/threonine protein kinase [Bifidobacterium aemilianum]
MTEAVENPLGQTIDGRYDIVRKIADGGMATVYEARDNRLDRRVAIKVMHTQLAQGPHREQFVQRFQREARSAASIANAHIVQVYDTGEFQGLDYLVMEYVHGVNLRHEMNQQVTFTVRETLRIVSQTLDGLAAAHRAGLVHRDIKPENILLNDRGHVQITDFGLAKAVSQATLSSTGMLLGTAAYLAPEMIADNLATPQGDLYSVGIMAWEMLTGQVPFQSDNPVTLVFKHVHEDVPSLLTLCPELDPAVAEFIGQLCARKVEDRPDDAGQASAMLRKLTSTLAIDSWLYRRGPKLAAAGGQETGLKAGILAASAGKNAGQETTAVPAASPASGTTPNHGADDAAVGISHEEANRPLPSAASPAPEEGKPSHSDPEANTGSDSTLPVAVQATGDSGQPAQAWEDQYAGQSDGPVKQDGPTNQAAWQTSVLPPADQPTQDLAGANQAPNQAQGQTARAGRSSAYRPQRFAQTQTIATATMSEGGTADLIISPATEDSITGQSVDPTTGQAREVRGHKSHKGLIIGLVAFLILASLGGGSGWWYFMGPGSYWTMPKPSDLTCPDQGVCTISDVSWDSYESTLKVAGIPYRISKDYSDNVAKGKVISTDPDAVGSRVSKRHEQPVKVVISRGIEQATVPKDIDNSASVAGKDPIAALKRAGFSRIDHQDDKDQYSETLPAGALVSIDPQPGSTVNHNQTVHLVLSKGPMPVSMPDVLGRDKDQAQTAFDDAKLRPSYSEEFSDTVPAGSVISASVDKGAQLHWGDEVKVVVSKGPETVTLPDVRGKDANEAQKILEALGLQVKVSAPLLDFTHVVRFQDPAPGQQVRVRDDQGKKTVITLTVV